MNKLKVSEFKDSGEFKKYFMDVGDAIHVKENLRVAFSSRYIDKGLCSISNEVRVIGIFVIIKDNGEYTLMNKPVMLTLTPEKITDVEINDTEHKLLHFSKGSTFIKNSLVLKDSSFMFNLFDEFLFRGKIPWYIKENDFSTMLLESRKYCDSKVGDDPLIYEILTSIITRDVSDPNIFYREVSDKTKNYRYIGLMNVFYSYRNTIDKLVGSYHSKAIGAAIIHKETESSAMEDILRA